MEYRVGHAKLTQLSNREEGIEMATFRVQGDSDYEAWPETVHAARSMRRIARSTRVGHAHALTAAVVMTAFSIEAFVQTVGPSFYGLAWTAKPRPAERLPIREKLKHIGREVGVPVDYGAQPWKQAADLLSARDALAHPKPESRGATIDLQAADADEAIAKWRDLTFARHNPMHNIDALDRVATDIEGALLAIWTASGRSGDVLTTWGMTMWQVTRIDRG
ncbi:hypothetical protein [Xanthomonas sacchari]|uniref:hypothetical protein n=1 Tax=Xanthomonas sacchari TaxID=56458 RepID=UPI002253AEB3|nr:hypothetical protein [Xanthomonas sacchari]MCW0447214.1 hypothetical protein [Xanthomonas sacchari]